MKTYRQCMQRPRGQAGVSLAEMLAVLAIVAIVIAIGIPLVDERLRIAEARTAADDMALHLRAARMLAVARHKTIVVVVNVEPGNSFSYEGPDGSPRTISMPGRVKIKPGSAGSIDFHSDGSCGAPSTVTIESASSSATERWTLSVNTVGLVSVTHDRV